MAHSSFGAPCTTSNIVTLRRADGLRLPIHRELASLVSMLMDLTEWMGYNIRPDWTWGYSCRRISGTSQWSNHAKGASVDINAPVNPYASAEWHRRNANSLPFGLPRRSDIPQRIFELWEDHGWSLGVRYSSKPDPMHFEFLGSVSEARLITARLKVFLNHPGSALPQPASEDGLMYQIKWFKHDDKTAAYRVLSSKDTKGKWWDIEAYWVKDPTELAVWRKLELAEDRTVRAKPPGNVVRWHGGPFANV